MDNNDRLMDNPEKQNIIMLWGKIDVLRAMATEMILTEPDQADTIAGAVEGAISAIGEMQVTARRDCPLGSVRDPETGLCKLSPRIP